MINIIDGGVTAPKGFKAAGVACGLKNNQKKDIAVVCSSDLAVAAGVFTKNVVKKSGHARALVINSGNANACLGEQGYKDAEEMASLAAQLLNCDAKNVLVGSTGVIGMPLDMPKVRSGIKEAISKLSEEGGHDAAEAIMTTDLVLKEIAVEFEIQGQKVRMGAMAKGSGMIHPNMATMIGVITTDANISRELLDKALKDVISHTFNRVSVDGDTSVCDMVVILANGKANNENIVKEDIDYSTFKSALEYVCTHLSKMIAKDGEGATKLIEVVAEGAKSAEDAPL